MINTTVTNNHIGFCPFRGSINIYQRHLFTLLSENTNTHTFLHQYLQCSTLGFFHKYDVAMYLLKQHNVVGTALRYI